MTRNLFQTKEPRLAATFLAFGLAIAAFQAPAYAASITWTVNNANFQNGGTLTGTFDFDADTQSVGNFNLVTTVPINNQPSGFTYTNPDTVLIFNTTSFEILTPNATNTGALLLSFASALTDAGGDVALSGSSQESSTFGASGYLRGFTSGDVSAIGTTPEPGTMALLGGSFVMALLYRRRTALRR